MDIIYLNGLAVEAVIGIYDWERRIHQPLLIDLEIGCDVKQAARTDRIEDTVNYKAITKTVIEVVQASSHQLVESLAENIATVLIRDFKLQWLRLRINKRGAVRRTRDVGVIIERGVKY